MRVRRVSFRAVTAFCAVLGGCTFLRQPTAPMDCVRYPAPAGAADGLVVLLPGLGDDPRSFERHGFVARIQQLDPRLEIVAVDAHFGYYRSETIARRLFEDVIAKARRPARTYVVGVSMGGLGAAALAMEYPGSVTGMILLAPYVGSDAVVDEVRSAGGLARWRPPDHGTIVDAGRRSFVELWRWYSRYATAPAHQPFLLLGHGDADRLRPGDELVGAVLPEGRYRVIPGGHDWRTWTVLFDGLSALAFGADPANR